MSLTVRYESIVILLTKKTYRVNLGLGIDMSLRKLQDLILSSYRLYIRTVYSLNFIPF